MRTYLTPILLLPMLLLSACGKRAPATTPAVEPAPPAHAVADWRLPAVGVAAQPDLVAAEGRLLLSWIEARPGSTHALVFAAFDGKSWDAPREIARGDDWFVNWADTPHVAATGDGALWAHWLRQNADAKYAYDVVLSRSGDGGKTWSDPVVVNDDGTRTEHGFVSLWPQSRDTLGIAWLDGRQMAAGEPGGHDGHGEGAMTLRTAILDPALRKSAETELDPRTCDCCQTHAAVTARGPLLAYRDRDGDEIRDVATTRFEHGAWTLPRKVHDDRWKMPACPVNGPALAARGEQAWVAWYTAAGEVPRIRIARSADAGDHFAAPVEVDQGQAVQGRVALAVDGESAWLAWVREDGQGQSLWLARYDATLSREIQRIEIAKLKGRGRGTGFPQLVASKGAAYLAWTDVVDGNPLLRGAVMGPPTTPGPAGR